MHATHTTRRDFCRTAAGAALLSLLGHPAKAAAPSASGSFKLNYILSTSLYGRLPIEQIVPEVHATSSQCLDIWPERHANQREQIEAMGQARFLELLQRHRTRVGVYTCYNPGVLKSEPWMRAVKAFGGDMLVVGFGGGGPGAKDLRGADLRRAIQATAERLRPGFDLAGELGVKIAIENHLNGLLESPESLPLLMEAIPDRHVGVAFAPFHLPQDAALQARLIGDLGERIMFFYAWQYGDGSGDITRVQQMKQMPGAGPLDFTPLLAALRRIGFQGWTSIFMHPTPRGTPILPTVAEVSGAINRSREYLETCLERS